MIVRNYLRYALRVGRSASRTQDSNRVSVISPRYKMENRMPLDLIVGVYVVYVQSSRATVHYCADAKPLHCPSKVQDRYYGLEYLLSRIV